MPVSYSKEIRSAADLLQTAKYAVALTGAGISTPSGIPDFRSPGKGLWERANPMEVASLSTFRHHPERFYDWLRPLMRATWNAQPNPAHYALAELESKGILKAVLTQNIDGLHQRAGSKAVFEVHGSLMTISCIRCQATHASQRYRQELLEKTGLPRCPACGAVLKPDIVLFEEMLPEEVWSASEEHALRSDLFLVVGSSLEVVPAAYLPHDALKNGARLVIVNLTPTHLDDEAAVVIHGDAAKILPQWIAAINSDESLE